MLRQLCLTAFAALAMAAFAPRPAAEAASLGTPAAGLTAFKATSNAESVARRCWWRHGVRHCQRYGVYGYSGQRYYGYSGGYSGPHYPEAYPTGSTRWWQEMDRAGRGGRGGWR
jgi:hypothetical protein